MIDILKLKKADKGRWVKFKGISGEEVGRIKTYNRHNIFVVFHCNEDWENYANYTAEAVHPSRLEFIEEEPESLSNNYKYMFFVELNSKTKTKVFEVKNRLSSGLLGFVKWYAPWRKYCFFIDFPGLVFDAGCLADIQDFINKLMTEWRENKIKTNKSRDGKRIWSQKMIDEGIIEIDTESAIQLGFTSDRFNPASYLWRKGNTIIISVIIAKQNGMFRQLVNAILQNGFDFEIPTPCNRMREIGVKQGWNLLSKFDEQFGEVEILTNKNNV